VLIDRAVDAYFRANGCEGFSASNFLGLVGLSPCGSSRADVERKLLEEVAQLQLQRDIANSPFLPFLPEGPNNGEVAARIASHIGDNPKIIAEHGFGNMSQDQIAEQIEGLLNRVSAGDKTVLMKTIRAGQPDEARVFYDADTGLMVNVNPSAPGFGLAVIREPNYFYNFGNQ